MLLGKRLLNLGTVVSLSVVMAACGSNNDPETRADTSETPAKIRGNAVKGVIVNGIVSLYYENDAGQPVVLNRTRTDAGGNFSLDLSELDSGTVALVEITADANTTMRCDLTMGCDAPGGPVNFGAQLRLPDGFRLLGVVNPQTGEAFVTPLSHLIVQAAHQGSNELTHDALQQASEQVQQVFELPENPLLTRTPDLTNLAQDTNLSEAQLKQAIVSAALFEPTMSAEWSENQVSLSNLPLEEVVLTSSVVATQLLDLVEDSPQAHYATAVANISAETTEQYQNLTYAAPTITGNPVSLSLTEGDAGTLSVTVNGTGPFTYQWFKDDEPVTGATSASLDFSAVTLSDAGIYFVEVADAQNSTRSLTAVLDVAEDIEPIAITAQPQSQTLTVGATLTLGVSVTGDAPIFQWQRNGSNLPNGNNASYTLSNIQINQAGNYRVIVRNSANSVTSSVAQINVNEPVLPVNITSQPSRQSVMEGGSASFSVTATGTAPITYQWRRNGTNISGATSANLTLTNVQLADRGSSFDVVVRNPASPDGVRSSAATLDVSATPVPARIETQPTAQALTEGQSLLLQVSASGDAPIRYQWLKNNTAISGATSASFSIASVSLADAGTYTVLVENAANTAPVRSNSIAVTVDPSIEPVAITSQPTNQSVVAGGTASFSVAVTGTAPITYQWRRNGTTVISGANGPTLTLSNVNLADDNAFFDVLVSNAGSPAGIRSASATLDVSALPVPASIDTQPTAQALTEGQSLLLQVSASGDAPIRYQWVKGGAVIPGATGPSFSIARVALADAGDYYVTVENDANTQAVRSNIVTVVVTELIAPVAITRQPQDLTVTAGDSATFSVNATGGGFLTYQWYKTSCSTLSGTRIDNANAGSLTLNPVQLTDAGAYCVRITNGAEPPAVSSLASLVVLPSEIPVSILTQPLAQTVYVGDPVTLSVVATGNDALSYQWFKDNNATPVYTGSGVFSIASAGFDDAGAYRVTVRNTNGESFATSNEVIVRVEDRPSLLLSWSRPLTRIDGSGLGADQISGYVIQYGFDASSFPHEVRVTGADTLSYELLSLPRGTVYVRIATIDSHEQQGPFSAPLTVTIP